MSEGLNKVMAIGNLGADPELRFGASGKAVLRMRLAVNERWVDKSGERHERCEWMTVVFFGARAEGLSRHLTKGQTVYVEGRIQTRSWETDSGEKRYATEVVGTELLFLGGGQRSGGGYGSRADRAADNRYAHEDAIRDRDEADNPAGWDSDDIPFAPVDERLA